MSDTREPLDLSCLLRPAIMADPHPLFHRLRAESPVHRDAFLNGWVLTRYADCMAMFSDPRLMAFSGMSKERVIELGLSELEPYYRVVQSSLFFQNPPHHTRLRRLVSGKFTPQRVSALRADVERLIEEAIDAAAEAREMDLVKSLADPLPARVIARMLGIPDEDVARFRRWADDAAPLMSINPPPAEDIPRLAQSGREYTEYFQRVIAERRARPRDDLLSAMATAEEAGFRLSDEDLIGSAFGFLFAGHETSNGLIAASLLALLRAQAEFARLREDPALIPGAVEELLRHQAPAIFTTRLAGEDMEVEGKRIRQGETVYLMLSAANRDPARFKDPDRLDLRRVKTPHLSFGDSNHICIGAHLARLELGCVLEAVLRRMPDLRLTAEPEWAQSFPMRALKSLRVAF